MASKDKQFAPLFTSSEDVDNNACVNWCHDPLELYATAYKGAAAKLVKEVISSHRHLFRFVGSTTLGRMVTTIFASVVSSDPIEAQVEVRICAVDYEHQRILLPFSSNKTGGLQ